MLRYLTESVFTLTIILCLTGSANAQFISLGEFSGNEAIVDFSLPATNETLITTEYASDGVTFLGSLFSLQNSGDTGQFPNNGGGRVASNWLYGGGGLQGLEFTLSFDNTINRLGFFRAHNSDTGFRIEVFESNNLVESFDIAPEDASPAIFTGIEVLSGFDKAVVIAEGGNGFLAIDDLRFEATAVPEPSSFIIFGAGVVASILRRRHALNAA